MNLKKKKQYSFNHTLIIQMLYIDPESYKSRTRSEKIQLYICITLRTTTLKYIYFYVQSNLLLSWEQVMAISCNYSYL